MWATSSTWSSRRPSQIVSKPSLRRQAAHFGWASEVFGGEGGADRLGVDVLGGAAGSVDGEQDTTLEDEVARVGAQGESVEE